LDREGILRQPVESSAAGGATAPVGLYSTLHFQTAGLRRGRLIENPIINSPFDEPRRHFRFADNGITDEIVPGQRLSTYFIPIPKPKLQDSRAALELGVENQVRENKLINAIPERVMRWRQNGFPHATCVTRRLLEH
jgi:type III restriction enzyme